MSRKFFLSCASLLLWGFFLCCSNDNFLPSVRAHDTHAHSGHAHGQETQSQSCEMHGIPVHLVSIQEGQEMLESPAFPAATFPSFSSEIISHSPLFHPLPEPDPPRQAMPHKLLIDTMRILV